jgi:HTH-type transcriptional regulator / antitoxin HigA
LSGKGLSSQFAIILYNCKNPLYSLFMPGDALFDMAPVHPGTILRQMMEAKGWSPEELAKITSLSTSMVYSILRCKTNIGPETAKKLAAAFGNSPEEWLKWDILVRLATTEADVSTVERMARLYDIAPLGDMQKRGWIPVTDDVDELESELKRFFDSDLSGEVTFPVRLRRNVRIPKLSAPERAWLFRARQLAVNVPIRTTFSTKRLDSAERKLRQLAAYRKEIGRVPGVLADNGIRFVIVEPIPGVKIDGATFWLDTEPVIAMSLRHDRIDGFWFTLMHEFAHVRNEDAISVDELIDGTKGINVMLVEDEAERRANEAAASALVPKEELESFIRRVGPLYARERVIQFAHKVKIHPGVIVGQLQHRNELGYSALRDLLVKVRDVVTATALTDGWNQSVAPAIL